MVSMHLYSSSLLLYLHTYIAPPLNQSHLDSNCIKRDGGSHQHPYKQRKRPNESLTTSPVWWSQWEEGGGTNAHKPWNTEKHTHTHRGSVSAQMDVFTLIVYKSPKRLNFLVWSPSAMSYVQSFRWGCKYTTSCFWTLTETHCMQTL